MLLQITYFFFSLGGNSFSNQFSLVLSAKITQVFGTCIRCVLHHVCNIPTPESLSNVPIYHSFPPSSSKFHKAPHRTLSPQWVAVQLLNNPAEYSFNVFQIHISKNSYDITKPDVVQKTKALSTCHKGEPSVRNKIFFLHQMLLCALQDKGVCALVFHLVYVALVYRCPAMS